MTLISNKQPLLKYLLSSLLLFAVLSASAQLTYENLYVDYDSAWTFKNLRIIPVRRKAGRRYAR